MADSILAKIYLGSEAKLEIVQGPGNSIMLRSAQDPGETCHIPADLILIVVESLLTVRNRFIGEKGTFVATGRRGASA